MAYDRDYSDNTDWYRDTGSRRDRGYTSARDYSATDESRDDRNFRGGGTGYGDPRQDRDRGRETHGGGSDYYGGDRSAGGRSGYGAGVTGGSYASDGRRFAQPEGRGYGSRDWDRERGQSRLPSQGRPQDRGYGRQPQGYDYDDRGFLARAGDEVRSWFGDEDAERRREYDQRYDERFAGDDHGRTAHGRDGDYHDWRRGQIDALDRDYREYRQENARKFDNEFGTWRSQRQSQRTSLSSVNEHMEVVGSDGEHVGTVDKVRGDRIILTKNDDDAGGRHHSIPSNWLQSVDDKVTISKTADDAKKHWRDEERSGAMFGEGDRDGRKDGANLNRSFSGTY